jgi:23S rRNA (adenine2503-C2)-methyltransferase
MAPRRVTVSTAGHVPGIQALGDSSTNASLAISLNATTDAQRGEIMPINARWPIGRLLEAARAFPLPRGRRITFEYVMLRGFNDTLGDARRLVELLRGIHSKVNLIPFNPDPSLPFERPDEATVDAFAATLRDAHLTVSVRWSKALDVDAACGQLAGKWRPAAPQA